MMLALFLTLLVGLFIFVGTLIGKKLRNNKNILNFSISMSLGVIIALIVFELFPEIIETLFQELGIKGIFYSLIGMLLGFVLLFQLDAVIPHHEASNHKHHHKNSDCHKEHLKHIGLVSSVALILHNIIEGMGLYIATTTELKVGLMLCIGIGLHNLPMGFMIESTLRGELKWKKIVIISLIVSLSTFLGGIIACLITTNELIMGSLLSITLGMLIYISFIELLPQIINIKNKRVRYSGIVIGALLLLLSLIFG